MSGVSSLAAWVGVPEAWKAWVRCFSIAVATALIATLGVPAQADPEPAVAAPVVAQEQEAPAREASDVVTAGVAAKASGEAVEVLSERTESSTTWINPDGSFTTEDSVGQVRFKNGDGDWVDVDLELKKLPDGRVAPKGHPGGLVLAGEGVSASTSAQSVATKASSSGVDLAVVSEGGGRQVTVGMAKGVGAPVLEGTTATYAGVWPGVDVVVDARRTGFEQWFVLNDPGSVAALPGGEAVSWSLPVKTKGLTAQLQDGSVVFRDAKGTVVSTLVAPQAWDAQVDETSGLPVNTTPVTLGLTQHGKGQASVTVSVDRAWVLDEDRVFPVTVDPTYASATAAVAFDTRVTKGHVTPDSTAVDLWAGTYNSGTNISRSYLNVATAPFKNKKIMSASLSLYETWAWSCTASPVAVHEANAGVDSATVWTNRPTHVSTAAGSLSVAKRSDGAGACAQGRVEVPITSLIQSWSTGSATSESLVIKAVNETDNFGWKKFHSSEGAYPPVIRYTYNRMPTAPTGLRLATSTSNLWTNPSNGEIQTWTKVARPRFEASTQDPDANTARIEFQVHTTTTSPTADTLLTRCTTPLATGGTIVGCSAANDLPDDTRLFLRARATDDQGGVGPWSVFVKFFTDRSTPNPTQISCPAPYTNGAWLDTAPTTDVTCTITGAGTKDWDHNVWVQVQVDELAPQTVPITPSNDPAVAKTTVKVPRTTGGHTIRVVGISRSLVRGPQVTHSFGYGTAGLSSPEATPRVTATGGVKIVAAAPAAASGQTVTAQLRYRAAGSGEGFDAGNWFTDTTALAVTPKPGQYEVTGTWDSAAATVNSNTGADERVPVVLEVQVCFTYGGVVTKCTGDQDPTAVFRVPHAFGNGFPVEQTGPGQVALFTGEFNTTVTDASVPGYTGDLSLSRTHSTYAGPTDVTTGVFGPGWTANIDGTDAGLAGAWLVDNTVLDGSLVLIDADGSAVVFDAPNGRSRASNGATNLQAGTYLPGSEDTLLSGLTLKVSGTGTATTVALTDLDGTLTTFTATTAPGLRTAATFAPTSVAEVGVPGVTAYHRDGAGRITRIVAPPPPGVTCPATGTLPKGCRALDITYATSTSATFPGDVTGQVKTLSAVLWDPASSAMKTTPVASYAYDSAKRLVSVTDPRTTLATTYGYGSGNRLTGLTPAGQAGYTLAYTGGTGTVPAQLSAVTRGGVQEARIVYGIDATQATAGMPDMTQTAAWGQAKAPTYGAAVFSADRPVTATSPAGVASGDWAYAALSYTDARGYTVNEASYGAGAWQVEATDYDEHGNIIRELDARAIAHSGVYGPVPDGADPWDAEAIGTLATQTVYNTTPVTAADGTVLAPAGSLVTDTYGPARPSIVPGLGLLPGVRPHEQTFYDQGAPNGGKNPATGTGYNLPTTTRTLAADSGTNDLTVAGEPVVLTSTTTSYDRVVSGDGDGWALGLPTKTTTGGITHVTRFDTEGKVIETRQPSEAATGTGPGTRRIVYYTAGANTTDAACGNKPEWAGLQCRTYHPGTPATPLPDERTTAYTMWLAPGTVVETSSGATRTSSTTYDGAGRVLTQAVDTSGLAVSPAVPTTKTTYSQATGQVATVASVVSGTVTATEAYEYDTLGRETKYTNELGDVTTTTYDTTGRVKTVTDPTGSMTYTYDGTDANGLVERRGLATAVQYAFGGRSHTMKAGYNQDTTMVTQALPGGITQTVATDAAGEPEQLFVNGPIAGQAEPGPWLGWHTLNDPLGRVVVESTPAGAVFDGSDTTAEDGTGGAGDGYGYERAYTYDAASRLVEVMDRTATGYVGNVTDPDTPAPAACTTRGYAFDVNSNRTALATGPCGGTSTATTTWTYGNTDATATGGNGQGSYVYDAFGRQTTIPAADTPYGTANLNLGYYADDAPYSISGGGVSTSYSLDVQGRRLVQSTTGQGPLPNGATPRAQVVRHYTDSSDNPGWVDTGGTTTKYVSSLGGDLGIAMTNGGAHELTIANPHGDVVTTITIPADDTKATGITAWSDYTEYGTPRDNTTTATTGGVTGYGWLGVKERATPSEAHGLTLMGARLYNPVTGRFTALDPVHGGNPNTYTYPLDPINMSDTTGQWGCGWCKKAWKSGKKYVKRAGSWASRNKSTIAWTAAGFIPGVGAAAWGYRAYRIVKFARASRGMSGNVRASRPTAWLAGRMWVGKGSRRTSIGGRISADGTRQYRPMTRKIKRGRTQANYESRSGNKGRWSNNYHVDRWPY